MMRNILLTLLLCPLLLVGQKPYIKKISPTHIEVGQTVTIQGSNLGGRVFFGGVEATSVTGSGKSMKATVPAGVTHGFITVLNNSLIAQSAEQFFISFSGSDISTFDSEFVVPTTEEAASDICMCDLDGDGKNDLVVVHNIQSNDNSESELTIYRNNTSSTAALASPDFQLTTKINNAVNLSGFVSVSCRDLDNDGKPDMIFTSNQGTNARDIFVYHNQSTVGTINLTPLNLAVLQLPNTSNGTGRIPRGIRSADMDGDGKSDLVVGNDTDNTFHVFPNTSSPGTISFGTPTQHQPGTETTGLVELADLDGDGATDIITMPFRQSNSQITVSKNNSIVGNFSFSLQTTTSNGGETSGVSSGDFDGDGLIDLVVSSRNTGRITTFRSSTTASAITFETGENLTLSGNSPFGVDLGDMNGDGKLDIISSFAVGNVHIYENTSTSGNVSFGNEQVLSTNGQTTQYVFVGDLNGDAKPDIAYTRDVQVNASGDLGVILNRNCLVPIISPSDLEFCLNDEFTLTATKTAGGATYAWEIVTGGGTDPVDTDDEAAFTITSGATATVKVTITQDGCTTEGTATFGILGGVQPTAPTFSPSTAQVCVGDDYDITVGGGPFAEYRWTRPDGSSVTTTVPTLSITGATLEDGGNYKVRAKPASGCFSEESLEFEFSVSEPPLLQIFNNGADNFCATSNVQLEVSNFADFTYQWRRDGNNLQNATGATLTASESGNYTVRVTDADNCSLETPPYQLNAVNLPVSIINGPTETCQDVTTTFTAGSTGATGFALQYQWTVDGNPVTATMPDELTVSFATTGSHTVGLTTSYDPNEITGCSSNEVIFNVTTSPAPTISFNQADVTGKCQADVLSIGLTDPIASSITSYAWTFRNADAGNALISTSPTNTASIDATTPVGVDSIYAIVSITTTVGCTVRDSVKVRNFPSNADISSPDFPELLTTDQARLEDDISINLLAENVVSNISWEPADNMSDPTAANVTFFPQGSSTIVTLSGLDADGCQVASEVTIELDNLRPRKVFSPNGDGLNDCWEILNIGDQGVANGCTVYIFDARGRNILVQNTFDQMNCVWNGTSSGGQVPEGVYYFVLKCDSDDLSKTGSILLAR